MANEELSLEQRKAIALAKAKVAANKKKEAEGAPWSKVIGDAVTKAGAGLVDTIVNAPENAVNLGKAYAGLAQEDFKQQRPELYGVEPQVDFPEVEIPPNRTLDFLQEQGLVGTGEDYTTGQRVTDAAVQGGVMGLVNPAAGVRQATTNVAVGAGSAGAGRAVAEITGSEAAGIATSILTPAGAGKLSAIDRARKFKIAQDQIKNETRKAARELGFVTIPENKLGEFVSNPKLLNTMEQTNQAVMNRVAKRSLGMPDDVPLYDKSLERVRKDAYDQGYKPLETLGAHPMDEEYFLALSDIEDRYSGASATFPDAVKKSVSNEIDKYRVAEYDSKDVIQKIRQLRADATRNLRTQDNPEAYDLGLAQKALAREMEALLERTVARSDLPPIFMDNYRAARERIAKAHTVEEALKRGSGDVDMDALARAYQNGDPIQGELGAAAAFANVFKPKGSPSAANREDYAYTYILPLTAGSYVANKAGMDPLMGALIGTGLHTAGRKAKGVAQGQLGKLALGDAYQNRMAVPSYAEYGLGPLSKVTPALANIGSDTEVEE